MNKNFYACFFFCAAVIFLLCANLQAQQAPVRLSTDEAVDLAIRSNLGLESSRTSLETKRRASELSWNQFIPQVNVSGTFNVDNYATDANSTIRLTPIPGTPLGPYVLEGIPGTMYASGGVFINDPVSVSQWRPVGQMSISLSLNAAMFENMNRLRIDYEGGLLTYEKAKAQLERDIRKLYHNMLLMQENIELLRSSFENVERQVQIAQANYRAGFVPELTLLQAQVARENMRPAMDQVENGLKLLMAQFAMYLGMDYNTPFELVPIGDNINFVSLDVMEMITQAATGKPDIQELRQTIMMIESARKMQNLALTPSLNINWSGMSALKVDPLKNNWFTYDNWLHSGSLSITVALRLHSLLPWSSDTQAIRNLDDQLTTATIGLAQMIRGTEIEVYNIVLALERTRVNTQALEQTVALAQQAYRLTEQAYRAGLQDYFQVQNAEQSLRQAKVQLLEQHFTYLNGLIDLEYSTGVPFGTLSGRRD